MSNRKIIGVTVGTTISPETMRKKLNLTDDLSGVYVGSGDMPDGYNVQIDPNGSATDIVDMVLAALPTAEGGRF